MMREQFASFALIVGVTWIQVEGFRQVRDHAYHTSKAFLPWTVSGLVSNTSMHPHWIGDGGRF